MSHHLLSISPAERDQSKIGNSSPVADSQACESQDLYCLGKGKRFRQFLQRAIFGRNRIRSRGLRPERRYDVLPQTGQQRNPWFEESAAAPCLATFGWELSSAVLEALLASPMGLTVAASSPDFTESGDLS